MIRYQISVPDPGSRFIHIEMRLDKPATSTVRLFLPAWRPGRYENGNFSKNIRNWKALDEKGTALPYRKITKDCWEIKTGKSKSLYVRYEYFANVLNAGSCWLDFDQLYVNGVHCFMYDEKRMQETCELTLKIPSNWKIACGMSKKGRVLTAKDYHQLVDSPLIASPLLKHGKYEVNKIPFHIWIQGECRPDWERILSDFKSFTEEQLNLFGSFPVSDYHFLIQATPFPYYHGVEHTNSTVLALGPGYDLMEPELYHELIGVACHELFHTWNVKTIRPADMLPYHYQRENYSTLGYIYEGVTTYYGDYLCARSDIYSTTAFLNEMSKRLQNHMDNAGRFNYSVSESSFDTWLDGYVPGAPGRKTSIYDEGCLLAMMLDLMIRKDTAGKKSLDDLLRMMNKKFGNLKKGYTEADVPDMLKAISNKSYHSFFEKYVHGAVSYDQELSRLLQSAGCEIKADFSDKPYEHHFGFKIIQEGNTTRIGRIYPGSVAARAGLMTDDEIISVNNVKVENNLDRLCRYFSNETVSLSVFSSKSEKSIKLRPSGEKYYRKYSIVRSKKRTAQQDAFFKKWIQG